MTLTVWVIQSILKLRAQKVIATAAFEVATSLFGLRNNCSFRIQNSYYLFSGIVYNISMHFRLASNIRLAKLLIRDEIEINAAYCFEAVDRALRAILKSPKVPFGGK